jgi:hypothetical protein
MDNGAVVAKGPTNWQADSSWRIVGSGDFNGDGKTDLLFRLDNPADASDDANGSLYIWSMNGFNTDPGSSGLTSLQLKDPNWRIAGTGDVNDDGRSDIVWQYENQSSASDPLNGATDVWDMNGDVVADQNLTIQVAGSANWKVAAAGDFNGDGAADILFRYDNGGDGSDPLNGDLYIYQSGGAQGASSASGGLVAQQVGDDWALVAAADYSGDGKTDLLFRNLSDPNAPVGALVEWQMDGLNVAAQGPVGAQPASTNWTVVNPFGIA